jgi:hypothetical protein
LALPVALAGVLVLALLLGIGLRSSLGRGAPDGPAPAPAAEESPPAPVQGPEAGTDAVVRVDASGGRLAPPVRLRSAPEVGDVVEVLGSSFLAHATGVIAQCDGLWGRSCRNVFPVETDGAGRVRALYRIGPTAGADTLVVEVDLARGGAVLDGRPPPAVRASAAGVVRITGLAPGEPVTAALCEPGADTLERCRGSRGTTADGSGRATTDLPDLRGREAVVVVDATGTPLVERVAVVTRSTGGDRDADVEVDLDRRRLVVGLALAALLATVAVVLVRATDWRAPAEAEVDW